MMQYVRLSCKVHFIFCEPVIFAKNYFSSIFHRLKLIIERFKSGVSIGDLTKIQIVKIWNVCAHFSALSSFWSVVSEKNLQNWFFWPNFICNANDCCPKQSPVCQAKIHFRKKSCSFSVIYNIFSTEKSSLIYSPQTF
jgi:hypothetical protein